MSGGHAFSLLNDTIMEEHKMKKRVVVILEVETDDDINITDEFIRSDLEQEIHCASNYYDVISIKTEVLDKQELEFCDRCGRRRLKSGREVK